MSQLKIIAGTCSLNFNNAKELYEVTSLNDQKIDDHLNVECRNFPIHKCAIRVKKDTHYQMFFDQSHVYCTELQDNITHITLQAIDKVSKLRN